MKKFLSLLVVLIVFCSFVACNSDTSTENYNIDYIDAESFEKALNQGVKVKGKVVQFYVSEYAPNSLLGINCHAGEHLNFLFDNKLDVSSGDTIVVRVIEEPSKVFLLGSWKIPCKFLKSVTDDAEQSFPETTERSSVPTATVHTTTTIEPTITASPTVKPTAIPTPTIDPNKIAIPVYNTYSGTYDEAVDLLKKAGFTNIETKAVYTLDNGFFGKLYLYDCDSISVNNQTSFSKGDLFDKNSKIVITYKDFKIKDHNIKYTAYTVSKLVADLDSNAMNAKEKYLNQYVALTGRVNNIDDNGDFSLYPSDNKYSFIYVSCNLELDEQKEQVAKISKGDIITVKGKITLVGDFLGYSMDVYAIQ